jgi:hypothetical protein
MDKHIEIIKSGGARSGTVWKFAPAAAASTQAALTVSSLSHASPYARQGAMMHLR